MNTLFPASFFESFPTERVRHLLTVLGWVQGKPLPGGKIVEYCTPPNHSPICRVLLPSSSDVKLDDRATLVHHTINTLASFYKMPLVLFVAFLMKGEKEEAWLYTTEDMDLIIRPVKKLKEYVDAKHDYDISKDLTGLAIG